MKEVILIEMVLKQMELIIQTMITQTFHFELAASTETHEDLVIREVLLIRPLTARSTLLPRSATFSSEHRPSCAIAAAVDTHVDGITLMTLIYFMVSIV